MTDSLYARSYSADLHDIACSIGRQLLKARIQVLDAKEKFGTVRVYCTFGWYSMHDFVYPGHHFNQFPGWLQTLDSKVLSTLAQHASKWAESYQRHVYRRAYENAIRKFPHYRTAILGYADWPELLEGL